MYLWKTCWEYQDYQMQMWNCSGWIQNQTRQDFLSIPINKRHLYLGDLLIWNSCDYYFEHSRRVFIQTSNHGYMTRTRFCWYSCAWKTPFSSGTGNRPAWTESSNSNVSLNRYNHTTFFNTWGMAHLVHDHSQNWEKYRTAVHLQISGPTSSLVKEPGSHVESNLSQLAIESEYQRQI